MGAGLEGAGERVVVMEVEAKGVGRGEGVEVVREVAATTEEGKAAEASVVGREGGKEGVRQGEREVDKHSSTRGTATRRCSHSPQERSAQLHSPAPPHTRSHFGKCRKRNGRRTARRGSAASSRRCSH